MRDPMFDYYEKSHGVFFPGVTGWVAPEWIGRDGKVRDDLAFDAQPQLVTTASSGIPSFLTTIVDPRILRVLTALNEAATILGEQRVGDWTMQQSMFPVVEYTGDVSSYGDQNNNGRANANPTFPQRQSYLYQTIPEYGELELDRAALAKINWAGEVREAAVIVLDKFQNLSYFRGVAGLENYGLQTDPGLNPPIAPAPKAWGGVGWWDGNSIAATANEIYADIQDLYNLLVVQSSGNVTMRMNDELVLALSPHSEVALMTTNSYGLNVQDMLKKNFKNLTIISAMQYGALSTQNPQGIAAGELVQLIAKKVRGQDTGWCAYNEKLRAHPVIRELSAFKQKLTQGSWGAIIRQSFAISQMIGV